MQSKFGLSSPVGFMFTKYSTLEQIGEHGSKAFYEGEIGKLLPPSPSTKLTLPANYTIAALRAANGTMTLEDMKNYQVSIRKAISIDYRGYKLFSTGAPSGGSVALSILKIIEGYDMSDPSMLNVSIHRLDEAMRFSYAARAELGDPDFFNYMDDFEEAMLQPKTAEMIRRRIFDDRTQNASAYSPKGYMAPDNHGTSHIVAADESGMTITSTSTVNLLFGSRLVVPETGMWSHFLVVPSNFTIFKWSYADWTCRSNNEQSNERLLHPPHLQRIRLRPLPRKLYPA
jgi:gamma-glutamyltranspeptidase/glutathione hydrolase